MAIDKDEFLNQMKELLKDEVSKISYDTWIKTLDIISIENNHVVFSALSDYQQDFIENKFNILILNTLKYMTNKEWTFSVVDVSQDNGSEGQVISDKKSNVSDAELETNHSTFKSKIYI